MCCYRLNSRLLRRLRLRAAIFALSAFAGVLVAESRRPNVILILTDDQGYGDLSCHGNPYIKTPNLDALHKESLRFTDFHVYPTCSPSRAMLMSGRYPTRSGVWHTIMGRSIMDREEVTMADIFQANGYRTAIFGKWHLGDNYPYRPQDRGFDDVLIHLGGGVGNIPDSWANSYFQDTYQRNGVPEKLDGYCTEVWFNETIQFIRRNHDRPFFCYLATNAPHQPYVAPERYVAPYRDLGLEPALAGMYGMISCIDEHIGRLRDVLRELGLDRNTILIFSTDNGTSGPARNMNAGMRGWKSYEYDGGHRVPLFLHWPGGGFSSGRDITNLTSGADLLPTLIELCGLRRNEGPELDGISLVQLMNGDVQAPVWKSRVLFVDSQRTEIPVRWRKTAVMQDRWRLVNGLELYDVKLDPGQTRDIAAAHPEKVKELIQAYDTWWNSLKPVFSRENSIVVGSRHETPTVLTTHDVHGQVVWNQDSVLAGSPTHGYWAIEIARSGIYEFRLRRWPLEVDAAINSAIPVPDKLKDMNYFNRKFSFAQNNDLSNKFTATYARIRVGSEDRIRAVEQSSHEIAFRVPLESGRTRLQAWFVDGNDEGSVCTAYYVIVERVGDIDMN